VKKQVMIMMLCWCLMEVSCRPETWGAAWYWPEVRLMPCIAVPFRRSCKC
jgi:hypothetical protein